MAFEVRQEKFEGPLEALLEIIEKERLSISDISLAKIADEYLALVRARESADPEEMAGFLVIAAQLMLLKSRTLLPDLDLTPEEESSIGELEARMRELQKFRAHAENMRALEKQRMKIFSREAYVSAVPLFYPPPRDTCTPDILARTLAHVLAAIPKIEKLAEEKIKRIISLEEKIAEIRGRMEGAISRGFSQLVAGGAEKMELIVSFLALLELYRQKFVEVRQDGLFGDITVDAISEKP